MRPPLPGRRRNIRYQLAVGVVVRSDDDGVTVLDTARGRYWRGNSSVAPALEAMRHPADIEEVVAQLEDAYDVDHDLVARDVAALLDQLCSARLLRRVRR